MFAKPEPINSSNGTIIFIHKGNVRKGIIFKRILDALNLHQIPHEKLIIDESLLMKMKTCNNSQVSTRKNNRSSSRKTPREGTSKHQLALSQSKHKNVHKPFGPRSEKTNVIKDKAHETTDLQLTALKIYINKLSVKKNWVLLVELTTINLLKLDQLSSSYNFNYHWIESSGMRRKINSQVDQILQDIIQFNTVRVPVEHKLEILHAGSGTSCSSLPSRSGIPIVTLGGISDNESITSVSDEDESEDENRLSSEFEIKSDSNYDFFKSIPQIDLRTLFEMGLRTSSRNHKVSRIIEKECCFVVVVRDLFPKGNSQLGNLLKRMLGRQGITTYMIKVSNLMKQRKALELMKYYDPDLRNGCRTLILNGIHLKLSEQKHHVIIVDCEDESIVKMFPIFEFCVQAGVKTIILEKRSDGSFEYNLNHVYKSIKKGVHAAEMKRNIQASRPKIYRIPQLNSDFVQQLTGSGNKPKKEIAEIYPTMSPSEHPLEKLQKSDPSISDIKNDNTLIVSSAEMSTNILFVSNQCQGSSLVNKALSIDRNANKNSPQQIDFKKDVEVDDTGNVNVGTSVPESQGHKSTKTDTDDDDRASIEAALRHTEVAPAPMAEIKPVPSTSSKTKVLVRKSSRDRLKLQSSTRNSLSTSASSKIILSKEARSGEEYTSSDESESETSFEALKKAPETTTSSSTSSVTQSKTSLKKGRDPKRKSHTHQLIKIQKLPDSSGMGSRDGIEDSRSQDDESTLFKGWVGVIDEEKLRAKIKMNRKNNKNIFRRFFGTLRHLIQGLFRKKLNPSISNNNNSNLYNNNRRSSSPLISPKTSHSRKININPSKSSRNSYKNYGSQRLGPAESRTSRIHPGPGLEDSLIMHH